MKVRMIAASLVLGLGSLATAAVAQQGPALVRTQWGYFGGDHDRREFDHGYRDGQHSGRDDARHHRVFRLNDHGSYRDSRDRDYREGYERGYREAYRANGGDPDRDHWRHDHESWDGDRR